VGPFSLEEKQGHANLSKTEKGGQRLE
jgi:hypothetical protein